MGRLLVIGASGQVGAALLEAAGPGQGVGTYLSVPGPGLLPFDLGAAAEADAPGRALLEQARAEALCICGGLTRAELCEDDPARALRLNCQGPARLVRLARERGMRSVYYSSEYVFDGREGPYDEQATPAPLSGYGRSKLAGERAVLEADPEALVLRTTVIYGPEQQGKNFLYQLAQRLREGQPWPVAEDQVSSPTYNRDLAQATLALLARRQSGVFNVVGPEVMGRATLAQRAARALGLDASLIVPTPTARLGQQVARPLRAGLRIDKLRRACPELQPRPVEAALHHWRQHPRGKAWP